MTPDEREGIRARMYHCRGPGAPEDRTLPPCAGVTRLRDGWFARLMRRWGWYWS